MKHKKSVEAVVLGGVLVVSIGSTMLPIDAAAATACNNQTDGKGSTISGDPSSFVKVTFAAKCSPNTVVKYSQSTTAFAVQGGSLKGNIIYGSTSEGGGGAVWCGNTTLSTITAGDVKDPNAAATDGCL